jgi:hypothetical protein
MLLLSLLWSNLAQEVFAHGKLHENGRTERRKTLSFQGASNATRLLHGAAS